MTDEQKKQKAQERAKLARIQRVEDVRAVMSTPQGRRFVCRLIEEVCGLFNGSFTGETTHQTAFLEGKRAVAIALVQELQREVPGHYVHMMAERASEQHDEQLLKQAERVGGTNADGSRNHSAG